MGILDSLATYEEVTGERLSTFADRQIRWVELCVCGHEKTFHGHNNGGEYGGPDWGRTVEGCAGPPPSRNIPKRRMQADGMIHVDPTCPCVMHQPVAEVDRPGRYYRQKTWTKDQIHPMIRGLKAQRTRLANSKMYGATADAELEKRFRWLPGAQKCRVCGKKGDDVLPTYVNEQRLSQMRCSAHYQEPIGEAP